MGNETTYWLKGGGTMTWAAFTPTTISGPGGSGGAWGDTRPPKVRVIALIGASTYIDRDLSVDEARETYKDLKAKGWTVGGSDHPSISTLRSWIFD